MALTARQRLQPLSERFPAAIAEVLPEKPAAKPAKPAPAVATPAKAKPRKPRACGASRRKSAKHGTPVVGEFAPDPVADSRSPLDGPPYVAVVSLATDAHAQALAATGPLSELLPHYVPPAA